MKKLFLTLALLVSMRLSAVAAPAIVHSGGGANIGLTVSLSGAPTNGNIVWGAETSNTTLSAVTMKDSNAVALTAQTSFGTTSSATSWRYAVLGSPTAAYTVSATGAQSSLGVLEISGSSLLTAQHTGATGSATTTLALPSLTVKTGDIVTCAIQVASSVTPSISFNSGTATVLVTGGRFAISYTTALANIPEVCSASSGSSMGVFGAVVDVFSAPPVVTFPGSGMVGDMIFEQLVKLL